MKRILAFLFCAVALTWSGCSKDDESPIDLSQLVGTWEVTRMYDEGEWDTDYGAEYGFVVTTEFREDGTMVTTREEYGSSSSMYASYVVESHSILVTPSGSTEPEVMRIEKLTALELILSSRYPGANYTERVCFRRVH
ncbi:MAG TPA: lipocalin family protein [Candidatus Alistipes merdavium]|nr:lipocalin family protein [Candidatus Alistipes merdavium]